MHPPVTITTVHTLKDIDDCLLELGMFISHGEALLVIEKC